MFFQKKAKSLAKKTEEKNIDFGQNKIYKKTENQLLGNDAYTYAGLKFERYLCDRPLEKIRQWRQRYSRPIVNDLFAWFEEQELSCPPEGPLNKAINYILNRRDELSCFLDDGAASLVSASDIPSYITGADNCRIQFCKIFADTFRAAFVHSPARTGTGLQMRAVGVEHPSVSHPA